MGIYWKASHCVYDCRYHIVWITKYRRPVLNQQIQKRLTELLQQFCKELYIKVIKIGIEEDHVHMYVAIPVVQPIPMVIQKLKGKASFQLRKEFSAELKKAYWNGKSLWAVGYFIATVGEVTHELIKNYVEKQGQVDIDSECIELRRE